MSAPVRPPLSLAVSNPAAEPVASKLKRGPLLLNIVFTDLGDLAVRLRRPTPDSAVLYVNRDCDMDDVVEAAQDALRFALTGESLRGRKRRHLAAAGGASDVDGG